MGPAGNAVERAFRAAGLIWAPAWLLNIAAALSGHTVVSLQPLVSIALVAAAVLAWALLLVRRIQPPTFVLVLFACSAAQLTLIDVHHLKGNYLYLTGLINSVVIIAGLLLPATASRAAAVVLVAGATSWLSAQSVASGAMQGLWRQLVIAGYYAIVDAMVVSYATSALRRAAKDTDAQARATEAYVNASARRQAVFAEHERITSLLHDTLINTLGAIRRGLPPSAAPQVRARCTMDLHRIRQFAAGASSGEQVALATVTAEAAATADALGLRAQVDPAPEVVVPSDIAGVVLGAVTELLLNVSKHTGDDRVEVNFAVHGTPAELVVTVRDFGPGWDGRGPLRGFAQSVQQRLRGIGGRHDVQAAAGQGTLVTIWVPLAAPPPANAPAAALGARMPAAVRRVALICGAWWVSLGGVQTALAWQQPAFLGSLLGLSVLGATLLTAIALTRRTRTLPQPLQWVFALPMAAVVALPQSGIPGCGMSEPGAWGPDGAVGLVMAMVLLGRGRQPALASILGLALGLAYPLVTAARADGACTGTVLTTFLIEVGTVLAVNLFRTKSESLLAASQQESDAAVAAAAAEAAADYRGRTLATRLTTVSGQASGLMAAIAEGAAAHFDTATRRKAGAYEQALRGMLTLPPELGALGDVVADCLLQAAEHGVAARLLGADTVAPPPAPHIPALRDLLNSMVAHPDLSATVNISVTAVGDAAVLTIVTAAHPALPLPRQSSESTDEFRITTEVLEGEILVTATWRMT
ncbi:MAG: hypothetical protein KGP01_03560 [Actinomycetales bacterium]|nr:hypothetical protein [Actinomycetales bacterium]